ncbi:hypothetical protein ACN4EG_27405, partial [Alkalinema pantanalense CENA528]|uniref:hypothetical protein n=1 Tax=Alkalinema pantanalense TaxID=1620705 RepID=UPI003D6E50D1
PPTRSLEQSPDRSHIRSTGRSRTRSTARSASPPFWQDLSFLLLLITFLGLSGIATWRIFQSFQSKPTTSRISNNPGIDPAQPTSQPKPTVDETAKATANSTPSNPSVADLSVAQNVLPEALRSRIQDLQINPNWLISAVDELSGLSPHQQIPDRQGQRWQGNLTTLITSLEKLSEQARKGLGNYRRAHFEQWLKQGPNQRVSESTVNLITDTQFFLWFPAQLGQVLNPRQLGQIWYAIAQDQLTQLPTRLTPVPANQNPFDHQGRLDLGESHIYQFSRSAGQFLQVQLKTSQGEPKLAIVQGNQFLARNIRESNWSGLTAKSGTYEVIISAANQPVNYAISIRGSRPYK